MNTASAHNQYSINNYSNKIPLYQVIPGSHSLQDVYISAQETHECNSIKQATAIIKKNVPYGSRNQLNYIWQHAPETRERLQAARIWREELMAGQEHVVVANAKSAFASGTANCAESSSAMLALLSNAGIRRPVTLYSVTRTIERSEIANSDIRIPERIFIDHCAVLIGDIRTPERVFVGDSWTLFSEPHTLDNSLFRDFLPLGKVIHQHLPNTPPLINQQKLEEQKDHPGFMNIFSPSEVTPENVTDQQRLEWCTDKNFTVKYQLHGIRNLGQRYINQDNPEQQFLPVASQSEIMYYSSISRLAARLKIPPVVPYV